MRASPAHQALGVLADLASGSQPRRRATVDRRDAVPIALGYTSFFIEPTHRFDTRYHVMAPLRLTDDISRLLKRARLRDDDGQLRIGWLWLHGSSDDGGTVLFPLVSIPVRKVVLDDVRNLARQVLLAGDDSATFRAAGEWELSDWITDPAERAALEETLVVGGGALDEIVKTTTDATLLGRLDQLQRWARRAGQGAGFDPSRVVDRLPDQAPTHRDSRPVIAAQVALYLAPVEARVVSVASSLRQWDATAIGITAFDAIYRQHEIEHQEPEAVVSSIVLSPAQRAAVVASRHDRITVVSGPPGTGKTQTISAIALDAVERNESVLIAAPTPAAVDALIELLTRIPGPDPIVFGQQEQRQAVADRLGQGGGQFVDGDTVARTEQAYRDAGASAESVRRDIGDLLAAEQLSASADLGAIARARQLTPAWFAPGAPLGTARQLDEAIDDVHGLFERVRRRRLVRRLTRHAGATAVELSELRESLRWATAAQHSSAMVAVGGLSLDRMWDRLVDSDEALRRCTAAWLDATVRSPDRITGARRATLAAVAAALRSGRAARRDQLKVIDGDHVADALPLWIGTLRDIDDLLPQTPGMFDVVIIDESSQVDQISAAPALIRARRAVVVGDPKQLRHVSFLSDDAIGRAVAEHGITDADVARRLDVRRMSVFDVAAAAAPPRFLDEHYRGAPHLIEFSARRFYDGALTVATTHPRNHDRDCISVDVVDGSREANGVNQAEIEHIVALVRERLAASQASGSRLSIGVESPFRSQADVIEARLVEEFTLAQIDELALRVGTVHGFQGCERDLVIISLAVDDASASGTRSFLNDANLFNVMVTRAREKIVVVTSLSSAGPGLAGEYVRHGMAPPSPPRSEPARDSFTRSVVDDLRRSAPPACPVLSGYRAGRHTVDLVIGARERALGVTFGVHPDGPEAHIERYLSLRRAGWALREVFASRWADRRAKLAVELTLEALARTDDDGSRESSRPRFSPPG